MNGRKRRGSRNMTEWNKLCEVFNEYLKRHGLASSLGWMKVRGEGDKLQQENQRLSKLQFAKRIVNCEDKLEAIRRIALELTQVKPHPWFNTSNRPEVSWEIGKKLLEVLDCE
jgi:hypothetical protein